ncbi:MAG TPA: hypothetical protein VH559_02470, partial [Gemmatimonadaceae bacterium]
CHSTEFLGCFLSPSSREDAALLGAAAFAALGSGAGLLIGTLHQTENWQPATVDRVVQLRLRPTSYGVAASVSLSLP